MSSATSGNELLTGYLAGHLTAERLAAVVTAEYYRDTGPRIRDTWRPIMDVVERAHPGVVELRASAARPGFDVRLAERPFPQRYETELRQAVGRVLRKFPVSPGPLPDAGTARGGLLQRIVAAVRKVF